MPSGSTYIFYAHLVEQLCLVLLTPSKRIDGFHRLIGITRRRRHPHWWDHKPPDINSKKLLEVLRERMKEKFAWDAPSRVNNNCSFYGLSNVQYFPFFRTEQDPFQQDFYTPCGSLNGWKSLDHAIAFFNTRPFEESKKKKGGGGISWTEYNTIINSIPNKMRR